MRKYLLALLAFIVAASVYAASIITTPLPFIFQNGVTADATQVNADLNQIVSGVNNNAQPALASNSITGAATFQPTGVNGTVSMAATPYNIASLTYNSTTLFYTATFTNALNNAGYTLNISGFCNDSTRPGGSPDFPFLQSRTTTSVVFGFASLTGVPASCVLTSGVFVQFSVVGGY